MVSVRFLRRLECLGAPPLKEARGTPRLIQQTMSAIDEVKRLGSTALPSSPDHRCQECAGADGRERD